jgi:hypothetical protein
LAHPKTAIKNKTGINLMILVIGFMLR